MSDWEDEDTTPKPKVAAPALFRYAAKKDDDWEDEPTSKPTNYHEKHERSRSSQRGTDGKRSNNNYMDCSDGQEDQISFTVGKSSIGTIIGRGGCKIKELQHQFRVKLDIGEF